MLRKPHHTAAVAWLLGAAIILPGAHAFAEPPTVEEVLGVLGMDKDQIAELAQGQQPVAYTLNEYSADELAMGVAVHLPVSSAKAAMYLRQANPDSLDVDVTTQGMLTERGGAGSLAPIVLPKEEALALLDAEPGDEFNLSDDEIDSFKTLKRTLERTPPKAARDAVKQHYREILFQRFEAYRRGGTLAIAPYVREGQLESKPSYELRQAANASAVLARYFPALHKVWLNYPKTLPPGTGETFPWVEKTVEGRPATILRHRVAIDWNDPLLSIARCDPMAVIGALPTIITNRL